MNEQERAWDVLDDILKSDSGMSAKEMDFVEDMDNKRNLTWTEPQIAWLDRIYTKVC